MSRTIVILQSNYLPWKGYLDLMNAADLFVVYDEVQFTRRDWRNRNKIVIDGQPHWLTIPVETKNKYLASVRDVCVVDGRWAAKHWASIRHAYRNAQFFSSYESELARLYEQAGELTHLSDINELFLRFLADKFGIDTAFARSDAVPRLSDDPTVRLVEICKAFAGDTYLSGPAAMGYIDPLLFEAAGIRLVYADYSGYPSYEQGGASFEHGVSALDILLRFGSAARQHLKSVSGLEGLVA